MLAEQIKDSKEWTTGDWSMIAYLNLDPSVSYWFLILSFEGNKRIKLIELSKIISIFMMLYLTKTGQYCKAVLWSDKHLWWILLSVASLLICPRFDLNTDNHFRWKLIIPFRTKKVLIAIIIWEFELLSTSWFIEKQLLIN